MNATFLGAIAAALLALLLLSRRSSRRPLLRSTDTGAVAALNRAQIARRETPLPAPEAGGGPPAAAPDPAQAPLTAAVADRVAELGGPPSGGTLPSLSGLRQRRAFLRQLERWSRGGDGERLRAVRAARLWGHREALPLLRRSLRDPHPAVMREAAAALETFRGKTAPGSPWSPERPSPQPVRSPRNVARTR